MLLSWSILIYPVLFQVILCSPFGILQHYVTEQEHSQSTPVLLAHALQQPVHGVREAPHLLEELRGRHWILQEKDDISKIGQEYKRTTYS